MRISDWSSDVCSSDLSAAFRRAPHRHRPQRRPRNRTPWSLPAWAERYRRVAAVQVRGEPRNWLDRCWRAGQDLAWGRSELRSEEHTSELQSLMRNSYAGFCLKKKNKYIERHKKESLTTCGQIIKTQTQ